MTDQQAVSVRDAATVILVRDAPRLEVLMLRRNDASVFVAGAHVFPGGALDTRDRIVVEHPAIGGRDDAGASERLGIERGGLAFWIAAARECFEEAGIVLGRPPGGGAIPPGVLAAITADRDATERGDRDFLDVLAAAGLVLDLAAIHVFAHWITPEGAPRRYDTRFFVAAAPEGQEPSPDGDETVEATWTTPADALASFEEGSIDLIFPTLRSLEALTRFGTSDELLDAVRAYDVDPGDHAVVGDHGGSRIRLPGDPADTVSVGDSVGGRHA